MAVKTVLPSKHVLHAHNVQMISQFAPGSSITCEAGALWITQAGDGRDHILEAGEAFVEKKVGNVFIEALRESIFSVN